MQKLAHYYLRALIISTFNLALYNSYAHINSASLNREVRAVQLWDPRLKSAEKIHCWFEGKKERSQVKTTILANQFLHVH